MIETIACSHCTKHYEVTNLGKQANGGFQRRFSCGRKTSGLTCPDCNVELRRSLRIRTNNAITKRYEKTKKGFLMRAYRNMQSRVTGVQWKKSHLYQNLSLLPREDFYAWSLLDQGFNLLFDSWTKAGFPRKISPSIDRIDSSLGYELSNIRWITHSENSRLGSISQAKKRREAEAQKSPNA